VLNVLEFGLEPTEAVAAPRTHHPWFPDVLTLEGDSWPPSTVAALEAMGHSVRRGGIQGDAHTIVVEPPPGPGALRHGVPDRRRGTSKASGE
jgi:gamma-glutamyltranspeptidase/glutathione hydrolase